MPKKLVDCVKKVKEKGTPENSAWPICIDSTGLKPHKKSFDDFVVNEINKSKQDKRKDILPGGLGDKTQPKDVDPKQLAMGIKVEMEHTKDKKIAQEIALDHLTEDPKYYSKLKVMEAKKSIDDRINDLYKAPIVNKDTQSFTDLSDMSLAKLSTPASLQSFLAESVKGLGVGESKVIPLDNGKSLKIYRVEEGIYSGHILEEDGSISHNIDRSTIPEISAHLIVKNASEDNIDENIDEAEEKEIENETEVKQENEGNKLVINININKAKNMNLDDRINSLYKSFKPFKKKDEDIDEDKKENKEKDEDIQETNTPPKEDFEKDEDSNEGEDKKKTNPFKNNGNNSENDEDENSDDDTEDKEDDSDDDEGEENDSGNDNEGDGISDNGNEDDNSEDKNDSHDLQGDNPNQLNKESGKIEQTELKDETDDDAHSNITYPEGYSNVSEHDSVEEQAKKEGQDGMAPTMNQPEVNQQEAQVDQFGNPIQTAPQSPNKKKLISHLLDIAKQHHDGNDSESVNDISKFLVHLHKPNDQQPQDQAGSPQGVIKKSKLALKKGEVKLTDEENKLVFDTAVRDMLTSAYLYCKFRHPEYTQKQILSKIANKAISDIARKMQWDEKFLLAKRSVKFDEKYLLDLIKQLDFDELDQSIDNKKTAPEEMYYSTEGRQVFGLKDKVNNKMLNVLEKGNNFFGQPIQSKTLNVTFKEIDYCELAKGKVEKKTDAMMKSHIESLFKK